MVPCMCLSPAMTLLVSLAGIELAIRLPPRKLLQEASCQVNGISGLSFVTTMRRETCSESRYKMREAIAYRLPDPVDDEDQSPSSPRLRAIPYGGKTC